MDTLSETSLHSSFRHMDTRKIGKYRKLVPCLRKRLAEHEVNLLTVYEDGTVQLTRDDMRPLTTFFVRCHSPSAVWELDVGHAKDEAVVVHALYLACVLCSNNKRA
jgi:hypothetical protein